VDFVGEADTAFVEDVQDRVPSEGVPTHGHAERAAMFLPTVLFH
jgi:hypothetical protein